MATETENLKLRKPSTSDLVNVETDLNENFDKIDAVFPSLAEDKKYILSIVNSAITWEEVTTEGSY